MNPIRTEPDTTESNVDMANRIVSELGAESAFKRRWLRFDEVPQHAFVWQPETNSEAPVSESNSLFEHLKPVGDDRLPDSFQTSVIDGGTLSLERFMKEVIPTADSIELLVPHQHELYGTLTTAVDPNAVQIMRHCHPVSRYTLDISGGNPTQRAGTPGSAWGLTADQRVSVMGIITEPRGWNVVSYKNDWFLFALEGCRSPEKVGLALFPVDLRSEFHPVRATIEAFSNAGQLEGHEGSFAGITLSTQSTSMGVTFYVKKNGHCTRYALDRGC